MAGGLLHMALLESTRLCGTTDADPSVIRAELRALAADLRYARGYCAMVRRSASDSSLDAQDEALARFAGKDGQEGAGDRRRDRGPAVMKEPAPIARQVGAALRSIRRYQDRKQYRVAAKAGITKGMLSAYERGRTCPSVPTLARLLAALDCTAEQFGRQFSSCPTRPASK